MAIRAGLPSDCKRTADRGLVPAPGHLAEAGTDAKASLTADMGSAGRPLRVTPVKLAGDFDLVAITSCSTMLW
jgi:hypothetical protein